MSDSPNLPILYSFRRCPYAMRARLALAVSAQPYELREISLKNKPAELLAVWPGATVPVMVLPAESGDSKTLVHSLDIMLWALDQADPQSWLYPLHGNKSDMLALIALFDTEFKPLLDRTKYPARYASEWLAVAATSAPEFAVWNRQQGMVLLNKLDTLLHQQALRKEAQNANTPGTWLYANWPSLADMAVLPFVRQFAAIDRSWFDSQTHWHGLKQWLTRWENSAIFDAIMQKHPIWQPATDGITYPISPSESSRSGAMDSA